MRKLRLAWSNWLHPQVRFAEDPLARGTHVFVKGVSSRQLQLFTSLSTPADVVSQALAQRVNGPAPMLKCGTRYLNSARSLSWYHVRSGDTIQASLGLRGGMDPPSPEASANDPMDNPPQAPSPVDLQAVAFPVLLCTILDSGRSLSLDQAPAFRSLSGSANDQARDPQAVARFRSLSGFSNDPALDLPQVEQQQAQQQQAPQCEQQPSRKNGRGSSGETFADEQHAAKKGPATEEMGAVALSDHPPDAAAPALPLTAGSSPATSVTTPGKQGWTCSNCSHQNFGNAVVCAGVLGGGSRCSSTRSAAALLESGATRSRRHTQVLQVTGWGSKTYESSGGAPSSASGTQGARAVSRARNTPGRGNGRASARDSHEGWRDEYCKDL